MAIATARSFAAGEIAPALFGRADTAKYATGLKTCRNLVVARYGGVFNRAGFEFVAEVKDSTKAVALLRFSFNAEQSYLLEFGDLYVRIVQDGAQVLESATTITAIGMSNPVSVTSVAHGYSTGDELYLSGVVGMSQVNGKNFQITVMDANTYTLQTLAGANIDGTGFTAYASGGTAERVYTVETPYLEADLPGLQYTQSGDVLTLVHPNYAPRTLSRIAATNWTLTVISFAPSLDGPLDIAASGSAGSDVSRYRVTSLADETAEESLPGHEEAGTATVINRSVTPWSVTSTAHGYLTGDEVLFDSDVSDFAGLTGETFDITVIDANTYTLDDTVADAGATGAQDTLRTHAAVTGALPTVDDPVTLTWTAVDGVEEYNVYRRVNGIYGYIGTSGTTTFTDDGVTPDLSDTPPQVREPFLTADNYPSVVSYFQQRQMFANTDADPEKIWASRSGNYHNLSIRSPLQDDDAVTFTPAGREVNEIRAILDLGKLIILTSGGEWIADGDSDGVLRPTAINLRQQGYRGASELRPAIIGNSAIYVQARGTIVRDLRYDINADGYTGNDLSIYSPHLFDGYEIADLSYAEIPHSVVWVVRSDGTLLGMTYLREQEIWGWHRHDTGDGDSFENVCVIPEGNDDSVYVVVKRTVDGQTKRYIERMAPRSFTDIKDAYFVDCGLTFDGRNDTDTTMTLSGSGWTVNDTLTLTASASSFVAGDVGNAYHLNIVTPKHGDTPESTATIRCRITAYTSATVVSIRPHKDVPAAFQAVALTDWTRAVDELSGLDHLEGETVAVFADGNVVSNGQDTPAYVVTDGAITLLRPYGVIHVGLPITADFETLDLENAEGESIVPRKKIVSKVTLRLDASRGGFWGPDKDHLVEIPQRTTEPWDEPTRLQTGPVTANIQATWNSNGRIFVRQTDPLPLTILSAHPTVEVGG